jgi:hypothetical protein
MERNYFLPVFDLEVVEQSLGVVLDCEAGLEQEAMDAGPFTWMVTMGLGAIVDEWEG